MRPPVWDDGWFELAIAEGADLRVALADRPVAAWITHSMVATGAYHPLAWTLYVACWLGIGWITLRVWRLLFPGESGLAACAAVIAVAPLVAPCQAQLHATILTAHITIVLTWAGVLLLAAARRDGLAAGARAWRVLLAGALVAAGGLICEYTAPTAVAGAGVLLLTGRSSGREWRRTLALIGWLFAVVLAAFVVYRATASAEARPETTLAHLLTGRKLKDLARQLVLYPGGLWHLCAGGLTRRVGEMGVRDWPSVLAAPCAALGALGQWLLWRRGPTTGRVAAGRALWLVVVVALAMLPFYVMGRRLGDSRIFGRMALPIVPVAACLTVSGLACLLRARFQRVIPLLIGAAAAFHGVEQAAWAYHERQSAARWGERVRPCWRPTA